MRLRIGLMHISINGKRAIGVKQFWGPEMSPLCELEQFKHCETKTPYLKFDSSYSVEVANMRFKSLVLT